MKTDLHRFFIFNKPNQSSVSDVKKTLESTVFRTAILHVRAV